MNIKLILKGFCMGAADLVPGVSGGTVAFILGIYQEFISSLAKIDGSFIKLILKRDIKSAFTHINGSFLAHLFLGILSAIFILSKLFHYLLVSYPQQLWSVFLGLVVGSIAMIIWERKNKVSGTLFFFLMIGGLIGYLVISLVPIQLESNYLNIFIAGAIAISAMILPGISGSFILLILGFYETITAALKSPLQADNLKLIIIFSFGCLFNLIFFSKFLKYLFERYEEKVLFLLVGFMIGSLPKLWPWRQVIETKVIRGKTYTLNEALFFPSIDKNSLMCFGLLVIANFSIIVMMHKSRQDQRI